MRQPAPTPVPLSSIIRPAFRRDHYRGHCQAKIAQGHPPLPCPGSVKSNRARRTNIIPGRFVRKIRDGIIQQPPPSTRIHRHPPAKAPSTQAPNRQAETGKRAHNFSLARTSLLRALPLSLKGKNGPKKKVKIPARALKRGAMLWTEEFTTHRLQKDLDKYLRFYNTERPQQGYRNMGKRPLDTVEKFVKSSRKKASSTFCVPFPS